jgi:hypothetical protein
MCIIGTMVHPAPHFLLSSFESGLVKMLTIGLAKHKGTVALHDHGCAKFHDSLSAAAEKLFE